MRILLPSLLIFAAACTPTARDLDRRAGAEAASRAALDKELAGLVPGQPQGCVQQFQLRASKRFGDIIVYQTNGSQRYVTRTNGGCGQDSDDSYLVTRTPTGQLCRGDIAQAISRTAQFPVGACSFGDFVPYSKPERR